MLEENKKGGIMEVKSKTAAGIILIGIIFFVLGSIVMYNFITTKSQIVLQEGKITFSWLADLVLSTALIISSIGLFGFRKLGRILAILATLLLMTYIAIIVIQEMLLGIFSIKQLFALIIEVAGVFLLYFFTRPNVKKKFK